MARGMTWVFTLVDNMSEVANNIAASVNRVIEGLNKVNGVATEAASGIKALRSELKDTSKELAKVMRASGGSGKGGKGGKYGTELFAEQLDMARNAILTNKQIRAMTKTSGLETALENTEFGRQALKANRDITSQKRMAALETKKAGLQTLHDTLEMQKQSLTVNKQITAGQELAAIQAKQASIRSMVDGLDMQKQAMAVNADIASRRKQSASQTLSETLDMHKQAMSVNNQIASQQAATDRRNAFRTGASALIQRVDKNSSGSTIRSGERLRISQDIDRALGRVRILDAQINALGKKAPKDALGELFKTVGGGNVFSGFMQSAFFAFSTIKMAWDGVKTAISLPMAIGGVAVDAANFKQKSLAVLDTVLDPGDKTEFGGTDKIYDSLQDFSERLRVPVNQVENLTVKLLAAKFKLSETPIAVQGLTDLAAVNNESPTEVYNRAIIALGQIKGKFTLNAQDLKQFIELSAQGGVGIQDVYAKVAKRVGMSSTQLAEALEDSHTKVESQVAVYAMFDAIATRLGGSEGKVGTITKKLGHSFSRLFEMIKSRPMTLFRNVGDTPGLMKFASVLENVIDLTSLSTKEGQELSATLSNMVGQSFDKIFGSFSGEDGKKRLQGMFLGVLAGARILWDAVSGIGTVLFNVFNAVLPLMFSIVNALAATLPFVGAVISGFFSVWSVVFYVVQGVLTIVAYILNAAGKSEILLTAFKAMGVALGIMALWWTYSAIMSVITFSPLTTAYLVILGIAGAIGLVVGALQWAYNNCAFIRDVFTAIYFIVTYLGYVLFMAFVIALSPLYLLWQGALYLWQTFEWVRIVVTMIAGILGVITVVMTVLAIIVAACFFPITTAVAVFIVILGLLGYIINKFGLMIGLSASFGNTWGRIKALFTGEAFVPTVAPSTPDVPTFGMSSGMPSFAGGLPNYGMPGLGDPSQDAWTTQNTEDLPGLYAGGGTKTLSQSNFSMAGVGAGSLDISKFQGAGGGNTYNVSINMPEGVSDPKVFADQLKKLLPDALAQAIESSGLHQGDEEY